MIHVLRRTLLSVLAVGGALLAAHALAHNSWVVSDQTRLDAPGIVRLAFVTGHESFPAGESPTQPERIASWDVIHKGTATPVTGYAIEENDLVARVELTEPGLHITAAALHPRFIELDGKKFTSYLWDEAALDALRERRESGNESQPGREYYTKFGKTFVQVGPIDPADTSYAEPVGHKLEIIPLSNPAAWTRGDTVRVRVLAAGNPIAELPISSGHESSPAHDYEQSAFTDADGVATFTLDKPGPWFIRTHVIGPISGNGLPALGLPDPDPKSDEGPRRADWESYWASITMDVRVDVRD